MKKQVHVVPHMHWDREWYFSTEESRILLVNNMEEIMERLENDPEYPYYVMDGQTAILEDYFAVKPENRDRVKRLVEAGKLIIGPWYTQTDEMVVGGESIVRNLLYGLKDCEAFGEPMRIGYLPDSFGQSAQMPQIFNGFDIKHAIFWRGVSERKGTNKTEFYWESSEGSKVLTQLFPLGYAIGKYLPLEKDALKKRMDKYLPVLERGATTEHLILPNGHDQMPIQQNIFEVMDVLRELYPEHDFFMSRYEEVFAGLEATGQFDTLTGEFLDGKYMRVHRSIFSTRMDIKALNTRIEHKLTNVLEPLATVAYSLGFEYHHGLIELIWKEIMKNHAHDSIGCCCSDKVHAEIYNRFILAEEKTDQLIRFYMRKIVDSIETTVQADRLAFFNLLPEERTSVVTTKVISKKTQFSLADENGKQQPFEVLAAEEIDPGLIDRQIVHYGNYEPFIEYTLQVPVTVPAMGYKTYFVVESAGEMSNTQRVVEQVETPFYQIKVQKNGTLEIFDKQTKTTYTDVLLLENGGDEGDEYDFSPVPNETLLYSRDVQAAIQLVQNDHEAKITIGYDFAVPKNLEQRQAQICDANVQVQLVITVPTHDPIISIQATVTNTAEDHRLRVLIPTDISAKCSVADNQFGAIVRDVYDEAMEVWEQEQWDERPDAIYPMLSYVGISDENHGVAVLTNSTREYEVIGENYETLAITLFRSVGFLGKEEMLRRPGRPSGIKLPTPDSQMLQTLTLDFALVLHEKDTLAANIAQLAKRYTTPIIAYNKIPHDAMKLNPSGIPTPMSYSLCQLDGATDAVLSVLKKAEKSDSIIARFYNPSQEVTTYTLTYNQPATYEVTNLNEETQAALAEPTGTLKSNQIQTIRIK